MDLPKPDPRLAFLKGGGEMGARIRTRDWRLSSLGPPETWPQTLKTTIRLMLSSGHPMFIWWGPRLVQFYNDAYRLSIGFERHPSALGQEGRQCWDEIWHIIGPQIEQVMSGRGATWNENALVPITRNGRKEDVYWTYSYVPIDDPVAATGVGGVLVVCTETTQTVQTNRRLAHERQQFARLFEQAPSFMAVLAGEDHRFEFANPAYMRLVGHRPVLGCTVVEAMPEIVDQGYVDLLDKVFRSGDAYSAFGSRFTVQQDDGSVSERVVDFVYQPIRDVDGRVTGIFVDGFDVTGRPAPFTQAR
ncbi:MAG: PAS domain-containing protein [Ramlibacter sp.]